MGRVLVTGGSGFIGSALVRALVARGAEVRVFDNNSRGVRANLAGVAERVEIVEGDVRDAAAAREAVRGCEAVYHLAYVNGTEYFYTKPDLVLDVGIRGHFAMMDACADEGVGSFIHASSSEVYQTPPLLPTPEDVPASVPDVKNPRYSYGGGKIAGELLTLHYRLDSPMRRVIFRPHNVYGPAMGFKHVIPQLVQKLHEAARGAGAGSRPEVKGIVEVEIEVEGDGGQTRAFCHVDDAVAGILAVGSSGQDREIYHVGVDEETSIRTLAQRLAAQLGLKVRLRPGPLPKGGTLRRCPDVSRLRALGWEPRVSLDEGLARTAPWYWNHYDNQ
ncbi:MAG: NAD-dependent epimerase/dehydratase family protein [Desulfovibrionaceae bacterium]